MFDDNTAIYFERAICSAANPQIFEANDFNWRWSTAKVATKKEQLSALHGTRIATKKKAFAWHGRGENQLHFSGESEWWPEVERPQKLGQINFSADGHAIAFKLPSSKVGWDDLTRFLTANS